MKNILPSLFFVLLIACCLLPTFSFSQGTWTQKASFPGAARCMAVGFSIGNKGYIGTGYDGSIIYNDFWEWDKTTNTWTQKANVPGSVRTHAVGFSIGNKGYIGTGGLNNVNGPFFTDFWEYNQLSNSWMKMANVGNLDRAYATGFSIGTKGYIGTGYGNLGGQLNDFWEWNGDSASATFNKWTQKDSVPPIYRSDPIGFSIGTKGYIGLGGDGDNGGGGLYQDFWEWDQATDVWTQKANYGGGKRAGAVAFTVGTKAYVGTGNTANFSLSPSQDFWQWDQSTNVWTQVASLSGATRWRAVGFSIGNRGYVATGYNSSNYLQDLWEYCPSSFSCNNLVTTQQIVCVPSQCTGTGTVHPALGVPPYTYSWSDGQTTKTATGLCAGSYTIIVTDSTKDVAFGTVLIGQSSTTLSVTTSATPSTCFSNDGSSVVTVHGGYPNYTYIWNPSAQTTQTAVGLVAGNYSVVVTDAFGCTQTQSVSVSANNPLTVSASSIHTGCAINNASAIPINGTSPFTYTWNSIGQTTQTATGLTSGTYSVNVTDANGCTFSDTITIFPAPILTHFFPAVMDATCFGESNGKASINISGGTPQYTYAWNPSGQITQTATGLTAEIYTVTVTDSLGCFFSDTITVSSPPLLTHSFSNVTNVDCFGNNNGAASVNAGGGSPGYSYSWNGIPIQTTQTATGLYAGVYSVTITDSHGCSLSDTVVIKSPTGLTVLSPVVSNVLCFGGNSGFATVTATGGTPGYNYSWNSSAQTNSTATGLTAGIYTVTITDNNGCIIKTLVPVTQPQPVIASISADTSICFGTNATENIFATGGTPGYTYLWMNAGDTTVSITISPSANTTYTAQVTDANGCSAPQLFTTVTVVQYPASSLSYQPDLCGSGLVLFTDNSNSTNVWSWNFGDGATASVQNPSHIYSASGSYSVTLLSLVGQLNCKTNSQLQVDIPLFSQLYIPNAFSPNDDGRDDVYYVFGKCIAEMTFAIYDRWGEKVFEITDPATGWDGRYKGQMENAGVFMYSFSGTLTTGEKVTQKGNITLMR